VNVNAAKHLLLIAGILLSSAAIQADEKKEPEKKPAEKTLTVPFELLKSRHMAVQVKINGKGPYRLIFDTGAPTNLINNKIAKESGVTKKGDKSGSGLFSMPGEKTIDTLEIGDVKLEKVQVMVMDHPTVAAISEALGPIDGLVGFPFFARFKTTIDYQKKELTLEPNGFVPSDVMKAMMDTMMSATSGKPAPTIVAPAALWGFGLDDKDKADDDAGVTVKEVLTGGPAQTGGLKAGDRILTIDGRWTDSFADTLTATSLVKPGRTVVIVVKRDGKEVKLSVKPVKGT
jgi:membrane-associated protease RseP (regulator of RpoE activity)